MAGISLRHGSYQVAHRLMTNIRPLLDAGVMEVPSSVLMENAGTGLPASRLADRALPHSKADSMINSIEILGIAHSSVLT